MEQFRTLAAPQSILLPATGHPWRRYFARLADLSLYGVTWAAIQYLILRWWPTNSFWTTMLDQYIAFAFMFVFEPVMLSLWGTTPGKFIMGLRPGNASGGKLSYIEALQRTYLVFARGMGYGIPIYNLVRLYKSRNTTINSELLDWEEGTSYDMKEMHPVRGVIIGAVYALCIAMTFMIVQAASLPLHRGELTPAQFYANCNEMLHRGAAQSYQKIDETGFVKMINTDPYSITAFVTNPPRYEVIVRNGFVAGVRLEIQGDIFAVFEFSTHVQVAYIAFVGAQRGASGQKIGSKSTEYVKSLNSSFEYVDYGVRVRNEVTQISDTMQKIVFTLEKE